MTDITESNAIMNSFATLKYMLLEITEVIIEPHKKEHHQHTYFPSSISIKIWTSFENC